MIKRKSFAKLKEIYPMPHLLDIQTLSYEEFLQRDIRPEARKPIGLQEAFLEVFPIESFDKRFRLEFVSYTLGKPKYGLEECRRRGMSFASPLRANLRLITPSDVKVQEVYFGELPLMTKTASFIINGDERVVVSQLQRSPGVCFEDEQHPTGKKIFYGRIIPYRGAWLEFKYDLNELVLAYVDRRRSFPATQILRILGFSTDEEIMKAFGDREIPEIAATLKKDFTKNKEEALIDFYRKMRPTEPVTPEAAEDLFYRLFFDPKRYDLSRSGRFILNRKLGMNITLDKRIIDAEMVIRVINYLIGLKAGVGEIDDIDHLGNRRIKSVGELVQNQARIGLARLERSIRERLAILTDADAVMIYHLINSKLFSSQIRDFFSRSQLSQFMDQVNPLAELTHKRRLSALGPGGLSRERAGFEVRDIHQSHYGRICPIETPEGPNIGLIASLTTFARINDLGYLESPYRKVDEGRVTKRIDYVTADFEQNKTVAQANSILEEDGTFKDREVVCRLKGDFPRVPAKKVDYMDVSPKQLVSLAASLIPFLEHDDANRALMGSNMQRQAVPLMVGERALVGTDMEVKAAVDSGAVVVAEEDGTVKAVDAHAITVGSRVYGQD
jgi:DNA-directed RNA polymerase subunit beta